MHMMVQAFKDELQKMVSTEDAAFAQRFFKTSEGQYGAGDVFIGVRVPQIRAVCRQFVQLSLGWMLREMGKRVDRLLLLGFLDEHAHDMPRTTLRYSIEHLPPEQKSQYMSFKGRH